jgi:hypothetical protein
VEGLIKEMFKENNLRFFFKLDIAKAFDMVSWPYLLKLLEWLGFSHRWRRWMCMLLSSASSKILLNMNVAIFGFLQDLA